MLKPSLAVAVFLRYSKPAGPVFRFMAFILGRKIGMTRLFKEEGEVIPVTLIEAGPITVIQKKTVDKDGYEAVQVGFENVKKINKAKKGHLKEQANFRILREFRNAEANQGEISDVSIFKEGDVVKISGLTKGRGFQGAVKRHGFKGMPASHGHHHVMRHVGSIGQRFPQHTLKGMRMAGRMGGQRQTTRGLTIISVDKENNLLAVKGAVPGRKGAILEIVTQ